MYKIGNVVTTKESNDPVKLLSMVEGSKTEFLAQRIARDGKMIGFHLDIGDIYGHFRKPDMDGVDLEIWFERMYQDKRWGIQNQNPFVYLAILGEEVGEANSAALESFGFESSKFDRKRLMETYRQELIQVAAVAKAMVECIDRDEWKEGV